MTETLSPGDDAPDLSLIEQIERICDRFEAACRAGSRPRVEDILSGVPPASRPALLKELLILERAYSRSDGGASWPSLEGYEIVAELGRGGMGIVYRAIDRGRGATIALKTIRQASPAALYRFKQEFRSLLDVTHPNLATLYELISDGQDWFISMELVEGVDFLTYVRAGAAIDDALSMSETLSTHPQSGEQAPVSDIGRSSGNPHPPAEMTQSGVRPQSRLSAFERNRLRDGLRQLAEGIGALHDAGKLHRDIKPSNVLVEGSGRVVLLDFGLAAEQGPDGLHRSSDSHIVGTAAYMAPEQAAGLPTSPASDWYSVGVILYEVLTGRLPFQGTPLQILMDKQRFEPPPPRYWTYGLPSDLDALCVDLLRRDPADRPPRQDVLRRLGNRTAATATVAPTPVAGRSSPLIGRERHLKELGEAFRAAAAGRAVALFMHGRSGAGKSALVRHFLDDVSMREGAVVLAGRCYEQESVPYKAFDALIDTLSQYLRRLPGWEAKALLPRDVSSLARVFPILRRVEAVAEASRRGHEPPDPQELRKRGFAALRELLARIGDRHPLVLAIDDLHWGDVDSAALLSEILRPPDPPSLLLLGCYRSEEMESPFLSAFYESRPGLDLTVELHRVAVEALTHDEARQLATRLLGPETEATRGQAESAACESGGNPFYVHELVQYFLSGGGLSGATRSPEAATLADVLWARVLLLPADARRLLEIVAVSGRPVPQLEACRAAGLEREGREALAPLRSGRLVRGTSRVEGDEIEVYHDRVRETVVAYLEPGTREGHHLRLAAVLEASGRVDPEVLAVHFLGGRQPKRAGDYYALAADQAAEALAFDRAAKLYRLALDLRPEGSTDGCPLWRKLGNVLADAGRGAESARAYLSAAAGSKSVAESLELRRRAALQYLISGHIDEGHAVLRTVLKSVGMAMPASPQRALWSLLWRGSLLRLRGLGFHQSDVSEVAETDLARIDIGWTACIGLSSVDPIGTADFQARTLLFALRAGEPLRISRALAIHALYVAMPGGPSRGRASRILRAAEALARKVGTPYEEGIVSLMRGMTDYLVGEWEGALSAVDRADEIFRNHCVAKAWGQATARFFSLVSLYWLGDIAELSRRFPLYISEAQERGDLYGSATLGAIGAMKYLAADDPMTARRELAAAMNSWSQEGFHLQRADELWSELHIDLYEMDGRAAFAQMSDKWPRLEKSMILNVQMMKIAMLHVRARCYLAAATAGVRGPLLDKAARDARRIERQGMAWGIALARLIRAGVASLSGDTTAAADHLGSAAAELANLRMHLFASAARRRLGFLVRGDEGRHLIAESDLWMKNKGIQNPERMTAMLVPGFGDSSRLLGASPG